MGKRVQRFGKRASFGIVCECDRESCNGRLIVTVSEYEHVRSDPVRLLGSSGGGSLFLTTAISAIQAAKPTASPAIVNEETASSTDRG